MAIQDGTCNTCGREAFEEEFGLCALELHCEDCMEKRGGFLCSTCKMQEECRKELNGIVEEDYNDYQPDEYTEWQDYMGGDDWDRGEDSWLDGSYEES